MTAARQHRAGDNNGTKWRFVRQWTVGDLLQFIGIILFIGVPFLAWARAMENRVLTLENFNQASATTDAKRDADTREQRLLFNTRMEKIEEKLTALQVTAAQVLVGQQNVSRPSNPNGRR